MNGYGDCRCLCRRDRTVANRNVGRLGDGARHSFVALNAASIRLAPASSRISSRSSPPRSAMDEFASRICLCMCVTARSSDSNEVALESSLELSTSLVVVAIDPRTSIADAIRVRACDSVDDRRRVTFSRRRMDSFPSFDVDRCRRSRSWPRIRCQRLEILRLFRCKRCMYSRRSASFNSDASALRQSDNGSLSVAALAPVRSDVVSDNGSSVRSNVEEFASAFRRLVFVVQSRHRRLTSLVRIRRSTFLSRRHVRFARGRRTPFLLASGLSSIAVRIFNGGPILLFERFAIVRREQSFQQSRISRQLRGGVTGQHIVEIAQSFVDALITFLQRASQFATHAVVI